MSPPVIRILAVSGTYLRGRLTSACNQLLRSSAASGAKRQILDGYLLLAQKAAGRVTGRLIDPPSMVYVDSGVDGVLDGAPTQLTDPVLLSLPTGRDAVSSIYRALSVDFRAQPARLSVSLIGGVTDGDNVPAGPQGNTVRGNAALSERGGILLHCSAYLYNAEGPVLSLESRLNATCITHTEFRRPLPGSWALRATETAGVYEVNPAAELSPFSMAHHFRITDNAVTGALLLTAPSTDGLTGGEIARTTDHFNWQAPMWVRVAIDQWRNADGSFNYFVATRLTKMRSAHDAYGINVLRINHVLAIQVEGGVSVGYGTLFELHLDNLSGVAAPEYLDPPTGTTFADTRYNAFMPVCMVHLATPRLVFIVRSLTEYVIPETVDLIQYPRVWAYWVDTATGDTFGAALVDPIEGTPLYDHEFWFMCAVGIATDGEETVYLAQNVAHTDEGGSPVPRLGVVKISASGVVTKLTITNPGFYRYLAVDRMSDTDYPGWEQTSSKFTARSDECSVETVAYMGNRKYLFPVSTLASSYTGEFDFSLAIYNADTNAVGVIATLETGLQNLLGDATPTRGVSVSCVQYEVADAEGVIITPAVLLASIGIGRGTASTHSPQEAATHGKSWISYDSGTTWQQFADYGSARGILYCGSATVLPELVEVVV